VLIAFILFISDIYHLRIAPMVIIIIGMNFINIGMNVVVDEIGLIQDKALPEIVAIVAKVIIGLIILFSSMSSI